MPPNVFDIGGVKHVKILRTTCGSSRHTINLRDFAFSDGGASRLSATTCVLGSGLKVGYNL